MRITRKYITFFIVAISLLPLACQNPEPVKPNFVFFLVDDLGWRDVGCFGSTFYETPNVDRLAREGVRFTNAYAASSVCSPTRASIMSGKHPARLQITDWIVGRQASERMVKFMKLQPPPFKHELPLEEVTIAEALKEAGYKTGFAGKWHLGKTEEFWPENQGFDLNVGGWRAGAPYYRKYDRETDTWSDDSGFTSPYKNPRLEDGPVGEYLTDRLGTESIKFIRENKDAPFLLFLSFYTVHNPMHGKPEKVRKYREKAKMQGLDRVAPFVKGKPWMDRLDPGNWRERVVQSNPEYAAMVESMDENIGRVLDALDELKLAENTVVVFMSDNGGLSTSEGSPTSNLPLRAGKGWLYEGGIREPVIIKWPGRGRSGAVCDEPVTSMDFYPTFLEMANLPAKPKQHMDGKSLTPLLRGKKSLDREALYWHYPHYSNQGDKPASAVRMGDFKLIEYFEDGRTELYNIADDLGETRNLAAEMPEKTAELQQKLRAWRKQINAQMPTENSDYFAKK